MAAAGPTDFTIQDHAANAHLLFSIYKIDP